jgi:anti-anti-sigma factor
VDSIADLVSFDGELDICRRAEIREALRGLAAAERAIVDLSRVRYFEACVLGELAKLAAERREAALRPPVVVVPDPRLRRLFELARMDDTVALCASAREAHALQSTSRGEPRVA